jgi:hypothetical protein
LIIDSIDFCTSIVSATFSSSTTVTPAIALTAAAPSAWAWL